MKEKCEFILDKKGKIEEIRGVCKKKDFQEQMQKIREFLEE